MLLASQAHLGTKNCTSAMERYVYRRRNDGIFVFNLQKTCAAAALVGGFARGVLAAAVFMWRGPPAAACGDACRVA